MTGGDTQKCGLTCCNKDSDAWARYPTLVCLSCRQESPPVDSDGNSIDFFNEGPWGGFISVTEVDGERVKGKNHVCFVKGERCYADETRFGGIVIYVK